MKNKLPFPFNRRWITLVLFAGLSLLMIGTEQLENRFINNSVFIAFILSWILCLASAIVFFFRRIWLIGSFYLMIYILTVPAFFMYSAAVFWKVQSLPDKYANDLEIPKDIEIYEPTEKPRGRLDTLYGDKKEIHLELYNSFQPGLYEFNIWLKRIEEGTIFLKGYEITENTRLSSSSLKDRSSIQVINLTDELKMFETDDYFTIYEGDWGHPYAARFEVWFEPKNGDSEQLIMTKNYKIVGWMR